MHRKLLAGLSATVLAGVLAGPAVAQTTSSTATVHIDNCNVEHSRNAGGFTWAYCAIVVSSPAGSKISISYRSNLATYKPVANASYDNQSGKITLGGDEQQDVKFAFKGKSAAQVVSQLKVTLSNVTGGATVVDNTAKANPLNPNVPVN